MPYGPTVTEPVMQFDAAEFDVKSEAKVVEVASSQFSCSKCMRKYDKKWIANKHLKRCKGHRG